MHSDLLTSHSSSPKDVDLNVTLGTILETNGNPQEAITALQNAITLNPSQIELYYSLARLLLQDKRILEAVDVYCNLIELDPNALEAYFHLGNTLQELDAVKFNNSRRYEQVTGYLQEAISIYQKALALDPNHADFYFVLGNAYLRLENPVQAEKSYRAALQIEPNNAVYMNNLGISPKCQGKIEESIKIYQNAIELDPTLSDASYNLSTLLLLQGKYIEAWPHYQLRDQNKIFAHNHTKWTGQPLERKTLFIQAEAGFGDTLQFIRFIPQVKALGANIILEVQHGLKSLLEGFPGVDMLLESAFRNEEKLIASSPSNLEINYFTRLLSLPALLNITLDHIPQSTSYLKADPNLLEEWNSKLAIISPEPCFKIGISWSGSLTQPTITRRSCSLSNFYPLAAIPGVKLFSLNKWVNTEELSLAKDSGISIVNLANDLNDFSDAAAAVENMDLIISVDTATVHLAGALGKPIWTLLPFIPDWRWQLDRLDTVWYPTMRLFRQPNLGDWDSVFKQVLSDLEAIR